MSSLGVGIVGLPNTGKTTLFNALSRAGAQVASYPFATKEPNVGVVTVPDSRLEEFAEITESARMVPATVRFIDIAGLAMGASKGEGLGNRFLAGIREVDAIVHVVRGFEEDGVSCGSGEADPVRDVELLETELLLSDLEILGRELTKARKAAKKGAAECSERVAALEKIEEEISSEIVTDRKSIALELSRLAPDMGLLTLKPTLIVLNVDESNSGSGSHESGLREWAEPRGIPVLVVNALIEAELAELDLEDAALFAEEMGIKEESLARIARASYDLLGLITFFTVGPDESKAWPIRNGSTAAQAAGKIHTDFERGFIKAEVVSRDDFVSSRSFSAAREAGTFRLEGRDYIVQDGDVIVFKFAT
ncbi:MAG: redox-regulated ATPase YchF [Actinobacteria bacterium]|nr:redox-regulated ATPase YchF [Actinomycetota bacterium]